MKRHLWIAAAIGAIGFAVSGAESKWWKGNLHAHTLWSDGDDYPEQIAQWYKDHGYQFLTLTDHNCLQVGERWIDVNRSKGGPPALAKYRATWGDNWVQTRKRDGRLEARLKTLKEFRGRLEVQGKFLLIQGEEVTDRWRNAPVHMNATNLDKLIKPQGGNSVYEVMQRNMNVLLAQRKETGQPMFLHLNHPNFGWGVTAEELMRVKGERFFEVYNGHPIVRDAGDKLHASTERMWDIMLTWRLAELKLGVLYGLATDDAHNYHGMAPNRSNAGRGWVMVRAPKLEAGSLITAMENGDFYSSTGVTLREVKRTAEDISLSLVAQPGVKYTTQFIGTRVGFDRTSVPYKLASGAKMRVTHRYSDDVGTVLSTVQGARALYRFKGDEIYVRAKVTSSRRVVNPRGYPEFQSAWVQPIVPTPRR
jgi:hypothetical protein